MLTFFLFHSLLMLIITFTSIKSRPSRFLPQHWYTSLHQYDEIICNSFNQWNHIRLVCCPVIGIWKCIWSKFRCTVVRSYIFEKTEKIYYTWVVQHILYSRTTNYLIKPICFQLIHTCVVDTSIVFPHRRGPPLKRALRNLTSELLQRIIQEDGM